MRKLHRLLGVLLVFLSSILAVNSANAQPCNRAKTAFIWINGVFTQEEDWAPFVKRTETHFLIERPTINRDCITFVPVYNESHWLIDFLQSTNQWLAQEIDNLSPDVDSHPELGIKILAALVDLATGGQYASNIPLTDPDLIKMLDAVTKWSNDGYNVVLVGHSQGTFYTNRIYEAIRDSIIVPNIPGSSLPSPKLSIVNIASAAGYVADGRQKYTTQCGDPILWVPNNLPSNINNDFIPCPFSPPVTLPPNWFRHLTSSYLSDESNTKRQIFDHFVDSLPDPSCYGDADCYLKDEFNDDDYTDNFTEIPKLGSAISEKSGSLWLEATSNVLGVATGGNSVVRTRKVFSGSFTASVRYNSVISGNSSSRISLVRARDNYAEIGVNLANLHWHTLTFTKDGSRVSVAVDGELFSNQSISKNDGYYLQFEVESRGETGQKDTLLIDELSVVREVTPPAPPPPPPSMRFAQSIYSTWMAVGSSNKIDLTLQSKNGMTGRADLDLECLTACPEGFTYLFPSSVNLQANESTTVRVTLNRIAQGQPGTYQFEFQAKLDGQTARMIIEIVIHAPLPNTGTVVVTTTDSVSTYCLINGIAFSTPQTIENRPVGKQSITCAAPKGYKLTGYTPSSATLGEGKTVYFHVKLELKVPQSEFSMFCLFAPDPAVRSWTNQVHLFTRGGTAPMTFSHEGVRMDGNVIFFKPGGGNSLTFSVSVKDAEGRRTGTACTVPIID